MSLGFNSADGQPQGPRSLVQCMVKLKGWSLPKPRTTGPPFQTKSSVVAVMEQVGVQNILTKRLGSKNPINLTHATINALLRMRDAVSIANKRGITIGEVFA